jgi:capsular exopolysaccharide synthesis family protein
MTTIHQGPDAGAALGPYVRAIRSRALVFVLVTLAALGAAAMLLATRSPTYESTAELLVTPLQQDDRTFLGITLLRDSGDPTRTVQTAAALIASPIVASRTATHLGGGATRQSVTNAVKVEPVGESNIVGVTARAPSAAQAAELANRYAQDSLALRAEVLRKQVVSAIAQLSGVAARSGGVLSSEESTRLTELRAVRDRGDPSLSLSQPAQPPTAPTDTPAWLVLALALVAGLTLGAIVAVLAERLDRRVRDVDELVALAPVPVLARVPTVRRSERGDSALDVPPPVREAFRTLQIQIDQRCADNGQASNTIVVTSASSGDGKTTTAICLALALVAAGHEVLLVDCDLRRPDIGRQLGLDTSKGLMTLLNTVASLDELLQPIEELPQLRVLTTAENAGGVANMQLLTHRLAEILTEARTLADYVIVDTAPLGVVGDALALTPYANELLLVGRSRNSDRRAVANAVELLERANTPPTGWVMIGDDSINRKVTYYYAGGDAAADQRRRWRPRSPVG